MLYIICKEWINEPLIQGGRGNGQGNVVAHTEDIMGKVEDKVMTKEFFIILLVGKRVT